MSNSELLNLVVTKMAEQKGYAYTTGYLQSLVMDTLSTSTKSNQEMYRSDLQHTLNKLIQGAV